MLFTGSTSSTSYNHPLLILHIPQSVTSNSIRNVESARVSVPHIIVPAPSSSSSDPSARPGGKQVWRTDLLGTEPYWEGWYKGLSQRFLSTKCARLLVLAGQERLDRELMVGQM